MGKGINLADASDMALVELSRGGFNDAFAELWSRHSGAVIAATRTFTGFDPDDVVQETFMRIFDQIQSRQGPQTAFRAYAVVTARNIATNMSRKHANGEITGATDEVFERSDSAPNDMADTVLNNSFTLGVFSSLPTKWQEALWYRDVEDLPINQCSAFLGLNENATTALVKRAREGFKQAWIAANLSPAQGLSPECTWFIEKLPKYVRGRSPATVTKRIDAHLATCQRCAIVAEESRRVHKRLALALLPLFLGGPAATGYLAWIQSGHNQVTSAGAATVSAVPGAIPAKTGATTATGSGGIAGIPVAVMSAASIGAVAIAVAAVAFLGSVAPQSVPQPESSQRVDTPSPAETSPRLDPVLPPSPALEASPDLTVIETPPQVIEPQSMPPTEPPVTDPLPVTPPVTDPPPVAPPVTELPSEQPPETKPPVVDPTTKLVPATLTAAPIDGFETGVFPRLQGSGIPAATVEVTVRNDAGAKDSKTVTVDAAGSWNYTPSNIAGLLTITAVQMYEMHGIKYVEEPSSIGVFSVGDGLRMSVAAVGHHASRITVTGLGSTSTNQVVNVESSLLGTLISKYHETAPGQVVIVVPHSRANLGELTFWQGDTSVGPPRTWRWTPHSL